MNSIEPTLAERILQYELSGRKASVQILLIIFYFNTLSYQGNYRDAAAYYERAIQEDPNELIHHEVFLLVFFIIHATNYRAFS